MHVTTRLRYALRAAVELAMAYKTGPVMVEKIAEKQNISRKYLENLLVGLKNSGLIASVRGSRGGYELIVPPDQVTAYDIAVAVEGEIAVTDCVIHPGVCPEVETCPTRDLWIELTMQIRRTLSSVTLKDLVQNYKEKIERLSLMYYI